MKDQRKEEREREKLQNKPREIDICNTTKEGRAREGKSLLKK